MKTKLYYCVLLIAILSLRSLSGFAQTLSGFTLNVTSTAESCPGNGALAFSTTGTQAGSTVTYAIYKAPDYVTAVGTTTANSLTGLSAGTYRVQATQSLVGYTSNTQIWNGAIAGTYVALTYSLAHTDEICGNDGTVTVTTTAGTPAAANAYSLFNSPDGITMGTLAAGPQTSNVFTGLAGGKYYIVQVTDACGQHLTQSVYLKKYNHNVTGPGWRNVSLMANCRLAFGFDSHPTSSTDVIAFPLTIEVKTFAPGVPVTGTPEEDQIVTRQYGDGKDGSIYIPASNLMYGGGSDHLQIGQIFPNGIPYHPNQNYNVVTTFTDRCGNVILTDVFNMTPGPNVSTGVTGYCTSVGSSIWANLNSSMITPLTLTITSAPAGYTQIPLNTPTTIHPSSTAYPDPNTFPTWATFDLIGSATNPIPNGTYNFTLADGCGNLVTKSVTVNNTAPATIVASAVNGPGCTVGYVNLGVFQLAGHQFTSARILSGPAAFLSLASAAGLGSSYPITAPTGITDLTAIAGLYTAGNFGMNDVPSGSYTIEVTDGCGQTSTTTVDATTGYTDGNINITAPEVLCGAFNVNMNITGSNETNGANYRLQYHNPSTGNWDYVTIGSSNNVYLTNLSDNSPNSNAEGDYRIVKIYSNVGIMSNQGGNGSAWGQYRPVCSEKVIYSFHYSHNMLSIDQLYGFNCPSGPWNVYISAKNGVAPYTFQITAQQGNSSFTTVNPAGSGSSDAFFGGLTGGTYQFTVTDACGNTSNYWIDVTKLSLPKFNTLNICSGSNGSLSIDGVPYLNFSWTKTSGPVGPTYPSAVLSTTNVLPFTNFSTTNDIGTYSVHMTSTPPGTCVDQSLSYTITSNLTNPNAGPNVSKSVCKTLTTVDLNTLLDPTADPYGTWAETTATPSGYLSGSIWSPSQSAAGTYIFTYMVNGLCSGTATSTYTITNTPLPTAGITYGSGSSSICTGSGTQSVTLTGTNAYTGGTYSSLPSGLIIDASTGAITPGTSTPGIYTITYTIAAAGGCSVVTAPTQVTILAAPIITATTTSVCIGSNISLTGSGTPAATNPWVSSDINIATVSNTGTVTGVGAGSATITYTSSTNACTVSQSVTVNALPTVAAITGTASICAGSTTQLSDATTGGVWSSGDNTKATVDVNGLVTGVAAGSATISYTITNSNNCVTAVTQLVTVNALPAIAVITGAASVCAGYSVQLADATTGGVWSSGDNTKATVNAAGLVTGVAAGTATISYTLTNGSSCVKTATQVITVNASLALAVNPASQTICSGSPASVNITGDNGATVTWTSNFLGLTGTGINFNTGNLTNSGKSPYTLTLTGTAVLGTCSSNSSAAVTVNPVPRVIATPPSVTVCSYENLHIVLTAVLSGTTINWTITDGSNATVASGSGIDNVTITNKLSSGAYTLKVTGTNAGCTGNQLSVQIIVD